MPRGADDYRFVTNPTSIRILLAIQNMFGYGLTLFFMLSAFLITDLLAREKVRTGDVHIGQFYVRRILRIWPLYYLGLGIGVVYALHGGAQQDLTMLLTYALMVGNWYFYRGGWSPNPEIPLWSVSIEEQFYLVWPSVIKWLDRSRIYWVCSGLVGVAVAVEYVLGERHVYVDTTVWTNTFIQFETFAVGAALALFLNGSTVQMSIKARAGLASLGMALWFTSVFWFSAKAMVGAPSGVALIVGTALSIAGNLVLLLAVMGLRISPANVLVFLGKISFGLYVFHLLFIRMSAAFASQLSHVFAIHVSHMLLSILSIVPTILIAAFSYRYFETPFLRLKERFTFVPSRPI